MGPLSMSAKQHREYLKLQSQEQREVAKMQAEQKRKEELHQIKLREAAAKANQGIGHKDDMHAAKLQELGSPLGKPPRMNKQKLGIPTQNPLADTGVFKQGQRSLYAQGTDTVPAMLTPGEAVIPAPAAQNPKNKQAIKRMVQEGRNKNNAKGYSDGTTDVQYYEDGTTNVSLLDKFLGAISGQGTESVPPTTVITPVAPVRNTTKEIPVVSGVTDPFQQWKNATMAVESMYGNHPKTWEKNNAGAMGLYGLTEKTFKDMQRLNMIPKEWKHDNPAENSQASEVIAVDTWKRAKGDPAKASAIWYSGPKAVDSKTGAIKSFRDPLNPGFPDTLQYVDKVKGLLARSGETDKGAPVVEMSVPVTQSQPTSREVLIAKQDLATSTNREVRRKAEEVLAKANQTIPTLADNRNTIKSPEPVIATVPPAPTISDLDRSKELANDPNISARDRAFFAEEVKRLEGKPFKKVGASEPKNVAQQLTGSPVVGDKSIPPPKEELPASVSETSVPTPEPEKQPSLIETQPEEANKAIAQVSQEKADIINQSVKKASTVSKDPDTQKSWLAKQIENMFSDTGLFSPTELTRFAVVAAGGMLTGGSVGGSLRYAGLDALKTGDARRAQQAEYKKAVGVKAEAAATQRAKDVNKYYTDEINSAEKSGQIKPEYARELRKAVLAGKLSIVENALGDTQNRFATPQYAAGVPADAKAVYIKQPGHTTKVPAFLSPTSNEYIIFNTDSKGNTVTKRVPTNQYEQVGSTESTADQAREQFISKQISPELFARDKNNKPLSGSLHISKQTVVSQLDEWAKEQRRLDLPDDYSYFASTINNALSTAAKSGELTPHVGKLLSMATINTASLTDTDKYIGKDNKAVPSSYIGDAVNRINSYSKSVVDNNNKLTPEQKKDPQTVLRQSRDMMDKAAVKFEAGKKLSPEELAEQAVKTGAVKRGDAQYNKIKEAPNSWWSYINYQMVIDKPKKE